MRAELLCPHCGRVNTDHDGVNSKTPTPDQSAALCYACGSWSIFTSTPVGLRLRLPTDQESAELASEDEAQTALAAWRETVRARPRGIRARPEELLSITRRRLKP